jgi:acyl-CoA synthetase (AMP-forming)/AMP-acid ligase II
MVAESLARLLLDHPCPKDEPLVCTIDKKMTAAAFRGAAEAVAAELAAQGVRPGQAVAVQLADSSEIAAAMFGIWLAGAVFVPVNARQPARETAQVLDAVRPAALLGRDGLGRLEGPSGPAPERQERGTQGPSGPAGFEPDVAFVMWTSGTTGTPKPILHTHSGYREILSRVLSSIPRRDATQRPAPNLIPVTLSLSAGMYNTLFGLMAGASVVLMDRFAPRDFATLVARYGIRSTVLPPPAMIMLTDDAEIGDLAPLRYVRSITAPLSPLAARRFMAKFGVTVLNGYGQSEVGEVIGWTAADARAYPEKLGAAGRPHPGVEIKVVDGQGCPLAAGESGELLVRPPRMAAGYADGHSLEDRLDGEGFVRTGDYAVVDDSGFVWIEGRATDLINRGGHKVFPDQVEEVLLLVPGVEAAAVAGVPDARLGEVPVAFVVGDASDPELEAACREHLVPYKVPVAFSRVPAIPRSEVGKVLRRQLVDEWVAKGGKP